MKRQTKVALNVTVHKDQRKGIEELAKREHRGNLSEAVRRVYDEWQRWAAMRSILQGTADDGS